MDFSGNNCATRTLSAAEFQRQCFEEILDFFKQVRLTESLKSTFKKREATALLIYRTAQELYEECKAELVSLVQEYPKLKQVIGDPMDTILDEINHNAVNGLQLLDSYSEFSSLKHNYLGENDSGESKGIDISASVQNVYIRISTEDFPPDKKFMNALETAIQNKKSIASVMRICKDIRECDRAFTESEMSSVWSSYTLIKAGTTLDFSYIGLGTSGFRSNRQTLIFTTDPGDDHIRVTARSKELMDGIAVHVEHIDRDKISSKELVEAYRLPAAIHAAEVRLHISDSSPVTAFIGRPVFENANADKGKPISHENFQMDKLKTVHMSASACSAMFQNGVADCKIAIERMYLSDAVEYMKSVVGNLLHTPHKQTMAAAFNLNTAYYDDKYHAPVNGECCILKDRFQIAKTAIKVAVDGGFDRVTWDGASDEIPSVPIICQLKHEEFTELVHEAHEYGLQTYFSAGLEAKHVEDCVYTGVDGLGIGTSLHYIDAETKLIGAFNPDAIRAVLTARNNAEGTIRGQGAALLARLDRLYFEQALTEIENKKRNDLFIAVCNKDEDKISALLKDAVLERIRAMKFGTDNLLLDRAKRRLEFLKTNNANDYRETQQLERAIENNDTGMLSLIFDTQREKLGGIK